MDLQYIFDPDQTRLHDTKAKIRAFPPKKKVREPSSPSPFIFFCAKQMSPALNGRDSVFSRPLIGPEQRGVAPTTSAQWQTEATFALLSASLAPVLARPLYSACVAWCLVVL